jgi:hypothetical protein
VLGVFMAIVVCIASVWLVRSRIRAAVLETRAKSETLASDETPAVLSNSPDAGAAAKAESSANAPAIAPSARERAGHETTSIDVVVTDREDHPIPDARIHLNELDEKNTSETFVTDSRGRSRVSVPIEPTGRLGLLFPGPALVLQVEARGFAPSSVRMDWKPEIHVTLSKAGSVTLRVLDAESRKPLPDVLVDTFGLSSNRGRRTDAQGRIALDVPDRVKLAVLIHLDGGPADVFSIEPRSAESGADQDLLLRRGIEIQGRVVDSVTRNGVAGAAVLDRSRGDVELTSTGSDGTLHARMLPTPENRFWVQIQAEGYCPIDGTWTAEELARVFASDIVLPKIASVAGVVRTADGKVVPDLVLLVAPDLQALAAERSLPNEVPKALKEILGGWSFSPDPSIPTFTRARTDAAGRFAVNLVPWTPHFRIASMPNQPVVVEFSGGPLGGPGELTQIDLTANVLAVGSVKGRLLLNGRPIQGNVSWEGPTQMGFGATTRDGRFVLKGVEAGDVTISTARSTGEANASMSLEKSYAVKLEAGAVLEMDLDLELPMSTIAGRVVTSKGEPVSRKRVTLFARGESRSGFQASTETGADGSWSMEVPASSSPCTIRVSEPDMQCDGVLPGKTGIDFVLPPEIEKGTLRVRVTDSSTGAAIPNPQITWRTSGEIPRTSPPANVESRPGVPRIVESASANYQWQYVTPLQNPRPDGSIGLEIPPGSIDLLVRPRAGYPSVIRRDLVVEQGTSSAIVDVKLEKGIGLSFRLAPDSAKPPDGRLGFQVLDDDELREVLGPDAKLKATRARALYFLGDLTDEREMNLAPGDIGRVSCLRKGRYHLVVEEYAAEIDPSEIDAQRDGETFEIRWKPK